MSSVSRKMNQTPTQNLSVRAKWVIICLTAALAAAMVVSLMTGSVPIAAGEIAARSLAALQGRLTDRAIDRILFTIRLPRILLAASVGSSLAMAGLAAQTLFRNPLASPYIIGVSGGSAVGAVAAMLLMNVTAAISFAVVPVFSIAGGLLVTGVVFLLGRRAEHFGYGLLLAGIAIGSLCSSLTAGALYVADERLQNLVFWLMGGFWRTTWRHVLLMIPVSAGGLIVLILLSGSMNVALTGDRSAQDLGLNIKRLQKVLLVFIALQTALAVSLTGVIGFVGLVVPHLLRLVIGADHHRLIPATAIGGALLMTVADTLARTLAAPTEIPVGILTAMVGPPVLLWLLQRRHSTRFAI